MSYIPAIAMLHLHNIVDTPFWQAFVGEFLEVGSEEGTANPIQSKILSKSNPISFLKLNSKPYPIFNPKSNS